MGWLADETGLDKCAANYVPLTPLSFLKRAARNYPDLPALAYGEERWTYRAYQAEISRMVGGLSRLGVASGDVVATLLPNIPAQAMAHFAVPATGAILNTINIRLEAETVTYILAHGEAKVILVDSQFLALVEEAVSALETTRPRIVEVPDEAAGFPASNRHMTLAQLLEAGAEDTPWVMPEDEWESIALNYTSGTTGRPKGVVYHHRGAYLGAVQNVIAWRMVLHPVYLTIVPLFHCNGWCHTWMMPMLGGTVVCCRNVTAKAIYDAIADNGVTHFGGAPIVLNAIVNAEDHERRSFEHVVEVFTAGAPPPAATLAAIENLGFNVTQVYGLTETYGPATECTWQPSWHNVSGDARAELKARTGVAMPMMEEITVFDPETMQQVPMDGKSLGEIMHRGNGVMKGYLKNPEATAKDFAGGWFHSGDIAFQHPDGYIKIADRAKDIIISGGENVSSVEVEDALTRHPAVSLCAVVAKPDSKWGEVPCAFVELKSGHNATEADLIAFARERLAGFKTPKTVVFCDLPKTSTGKIQKFELRTLARRL